MKKLTYILFLTSIITTMLQAEYFLVRDVSAGGIFKVDSETGDREMLIGRWLDAPTSLGCDPYGNYYIYDGERQFILKVTENSVTPVYTSVYSGIPNEYSPLSMKNRRAISYYEGQMYYGGMILNEETGEPTFLYNYTYFYQFDDLWMSNVRDSIYSNNYYYSLGHYHDSEVLYWCIMRHDMTTKEEILFASDDVGEGPSLNDPWSIAADSNGDLYVLDYRDISVNAIVKIDAETANREIISMGGEYVSEPIGSGPAISGAKGLCIDEDDKLYTTYRYTNGLGYYEYGIMRIDPVAGDREVIWFINEPALSPRDIAIDHNGNYAILDYNFSSIHVIDKNSFDRKLFKSLYRHKGEIAFSGNISVDGDILYMATYDKLYKYSFRTNYLELIRSNEMFPDQPVEHLNASPVDIDHNLLELEEDGLYSLNPNTGYMTKISGQDMGSGALMSGTSIIVDIDENYISAPYWVDKSALIYGLGRINRDTGDREIISSNMLGLGEGPEVYGHYLCLDKNNDYVMFDDDNGVRKVNRQTMDREIIIPGSELGDSYRAMCIDSSGNIVLGYFNAHGLVKIDPITLEKTTITQTSSSGDIIGWGPAMYWPSQIIRWDGLTDVKDKNWELYQ